MMLDISEKRKV